MIYLLLVSLIWAFSFGLMGALRGLDPSGLAAVRLLLALLVFLPFLRPKHASPRLALMLTGIGAVQYGVMYVALFEGFRTLASHEVALFTVFTPLYVTLLNDLLSRRFHPLFACTALLAVAGTALIKQTELDREGLLVGFLYVQLSNLCFAFGQVAYRRLMGRGAVPRQLHVYGWLYLGAALVALLSAWPTLGAAPSPTPLQWGVLLYLGVVASGLCFFLWNLGATRTDAGALAIFNNLKVPLAVAVGLLVFGESTKLPLLLGGGCLVVAALVLNEWLMKLAVVTGGRPPV